MRTRFCSFLLAVVLVAGCGSKQALLPAPTGGLPPAPLAAQPEVIQNGTSTIHWKQFTLATISGVLRGVVTGPDKNIWFGDNNGSALFRMGMAGALHEFKLTFTEGATTFAFPPVSIAIGADSKFYLTCANCTDPATGHGIIGIATTSGTLHIHDIPSTDQPQGNGLGLGPDGNVWFAETSHIAKITTTGAISEFAYPSGENANTGSSPVAGPDGNVWFTEYFKHKVAKINPSTHAFKEFDVSTLCSGPSGPAVGSDGKLYVICNNALLKITTAGVASAISNPYGMTLSPQDIIQGPNHHIWFTTGQTDTLGEYTEGASTIVTHAAPFTNGGIQSITDGPDGNIWGLDNERHMNVYILATLTVSPTSHTFTATGQTQTLTASYTGPSTLSATSASTNIATVMPGTTKNTFLVTSVGVGTTTITVQDAIGNLFRVTITVKQDIVGAHLTGEAPKTDPTYGFILGYFNGLTSTTSEIVHLTANDPVVFENVEAAGGLPHTVAFLGNATSTGAPWPASFTGGTAISPAGTAIGTAGFSTGNLNPGAQSLVYSAGAPGFYMMGCNYHYFSNHMRTVIIVQ